MTEEEIKNLYDSIKYIGACIAEDEPLNYSIARGLDKMAEAISQGLEEIANAIQIAASSVH